MSRSRAPSRAWPPRASRGRAYSRGAPRPGTATPRGRAGTRARAWVRAARCPRRRSRHRPDGRTWKQSHRRRSCRTGNPSPCGLFLVFVLVLDGLAPEVGARPGAAAEVLEILFELGKLALA